MSNKLQHLDDSFALYDQKLEKNLFVTKINQVQNKKSFTFNDSSEIFTNKQYDKKSTKFHDLTQSSQLKKVKKFF
jgi:hypothetical protein